MTDKTIFEKISSEFPNLARMGRALGIERSHISLIKKKGYFPPHYHYMICKLCTHTPQEWRDLHRELYETWKIATDEYYEPQK